EIDQTLQGEAKPTLYSLLDTTRTAMGARLLRHWLHHPLRDVQAINDRQQAVAAMLGSDYQALRVLLSEVGDIERISARIALKTARPRDLSGLRDSLQQLLQLQVAVQPDAPLLQRLAAGIQPPQAVISLLQSAIREEPASVLREGGVIADGYDAELDELRGLQTNHGDFLLRFEAQEKERSGITNLKVEYNSVHGFYIEISRLHSENVPDDYRRRQTLKNVERFITPELKSFEDKVLSANERALAREKALYEDVLQELLPYISQLQCNATAVAQLD